MVGSLEKEKAGIFEVGSAEAMGCMKRGLCVGICIGLILIFTATFCVGLTDPTDGKEQKSQFSIYVCSQCSFLVRLVLGNVKRKMIESCFFD